jgi:hypothetical protein
MDDATLLADIKAFLKKSGMTESYFGMRAARNSALVPRLEAGGTVTLKTAERVKNFMEREQT